MTEDSFQYNPIQNAMRQGLYLGLYLVLAIAMILSQGVGRIIMLAMFLFYPALIYIMVAKYRDRVLGGKISFSKGVSYTLMLVMFATIIFAGGQYLIYSFLFKQPWFISLLEQSYSLLEELLVNNENKEAILYQFSQISPFKMMLGMCNWSILFGLLFSLIIGLLVKKQ